MKLIAMFLLITALALASPALLAQAQPKSPTKPVRIITVGAGSQGDILTRIIAPKLSDSWGQPVVVENRAGAGGTLAAHARPAPMVFSSTRAGSGSHLNGEMFRHAAGIKAAHVGFKRS